MEISGGPVVNGHKTSKVIVRSRLELVPLPTGKGPKTVWKQRHHRAANAVRRSHEHRSWLIVFLPVNCAPHRDAADEVKNRTRLKNCQERVNLTSVSHAGHGVIRFRSRQKPTRLTGETSNQRTGKQIGQHNSRTSSSYPQPADLRRSADRTRAAQARTLPRTQPRGPVDEARGPVRTPTGALPRSDHR